MISALDKRSGIKSLYGVISSEEEKACVAARAVLLESLDRISLICADLNEVSRLRVHLAVALDGEALFRFQVESLAPVAKTPSGLNLLRKALRRKWERFLFQTPSFISELPTVKVSPLSP